MDRFSRALATTIAIQVGDARSFCWSLGLDTVTGSITLGKFESVPSSFHADRRSLIHIVSSDKFVSACATASHTPAFHEYVRVPLRTLTRDAAHRIAVSLPLDSKIVRELLFDPSLDPGLHRRVSVTFLDPRA